MSTDIEVGSTRKNEAAPHTETIENTAQLKEQSDVDIDEKYTYEEQRKIIHRVDRRLILSCGLAYCISLMDRTNVSMASIAG
jgi:hypothetical protein